MRSFTTLGLATLVAAASMAGAQAQTQTIAANSTYQVGNSGIKTGTSKTTGITFISNTYMDVEGTATGPSTNPSQYEAFGVLDFAATPVANVSGINSLTLSLQDAPLSFTAPGTLNFYLASSTTQYTPSTAGNLIYNPTDTTTGGIGTQLGTLYSLGSGIYNSTGTAGGNQTYNFTLNLATPTAQAQFLRELNGGDIRLAVTGATPTVVGTFYGSNASMAGTPGAAPTLSFSANAPVPEASTTASFGLLLVLGLGGIVVARRRKQA